ncbi:MAG TPA: PspC domain-containing protein [Propionibacteriaceae bacterium]|nr:PspC domain-containing protein [Propionibacteriaceae bacterium]
MNSIWTIRRSASDAKVAGLCGGLAQHWGIDPVLVRVGWVLLALSGGIGLVLYLAGWLLIPVEGSDKAPVEDLLGESVRRWPRELWITLVVVASLAMFAVFGWLSPFGIGPAIVIAVIWYFGFYKGRQDKASTGAPPAAVDAKSTDSNFESAQPVIPEFVQYPGPPTPFTQAAEAWQRRIAEHTRHVAAAGQTSVTPVEEWPSPPLENLPQTASDFPDDEHAAFLAEPDPAGLYVEPPPSAPVKMSDTRSAKRLRLVSVVVLGLTLSGLGIAQALGLAIPVAGYLAAALLVIGLALLAATWFGRARGLLPLGVLLAIVVAIVTAAGPALRAPLEATSAHAYGSLAELPPRDSTDVGKLSVDLSRVAVTSDVTYAAHVDLGQLIVRVPEDANVVINYRADLGAVRAYGAEVRAGSELTGQVSDPRPIQPGQHTLTLELSVDAGNIEVQR